MAPTSPPAESAAAPARSRLYAVLSVWNTLVFAAWIVAPFVAAGTIRWAGGWAHLGALAVALLAHGRFVARRNPELRARRQRIGPGTKRWDLTWNALFWPCMAAIAIVAGFGARRVGGSSIPVALWPVGLLVLAAGMALSAWAMASNPHFEGTARIQSERGHRVIEAGPYRYLRHPGYLGLVLWALASPLLLLSSWSFAAAATASAWIALRTGLEDAMLRKELPGYSDYARRTRFRLVPGVW